MKFATLADNLLKRSTVKTPAMEFGTLHESDAADIYAATYDVELFPVGFIINPMRIYLDCSLDRPVNDRNHNEMGLLEAKCTMKESVSDVSYLRVVGEGLQLQRSHQYYEQCMGLIGAMWCDFCMMQK
ncbi:hypothetical protein LSH36_1406g00002 [Paralvinella palmiformis]|uniref:YqaJ viral recombinase domain-containing protein n=1 Tax=Paralvinella palmiformis TaxID=53620 RepID=A0AAD9ITY4_9ANNE|nr:hypothetical protein LSH36_1406g00002 [Paralvinella palmiformis]